MAARVSEVTLFVQGTSPKAEVARHASARQFSSQRHCVGSLWRTAVDPPSPGKHILLNGPRPKTPQNGLAESGLPHNDHLCAYRLPAGKIPRKRSGSGARHKLRARVAKQ